MSRSTRHNSRILAFQITYTRAKFGIHHKGEELLFKQAGLTGNYQIFFQNLVDTTWEKLDEIDKVIQQHLTNWKQTRISETLNALLRISSCELLFFPEIDNKIVINEAIEICRNFVGEKATKFCNGDLHAVWQDSNSKENLSADKQ